ncbi:hypothetical protein AN416_17015 [Paraburkholderia caribensis]|nr:hypothetical protein AN416_17015 [Paraburkholderia caribensis]
MTCRYIVILRGWTMTCRCASTRLTGQLTKPIDWATRAMCASLTDSQLPQGTNSFRSESALTPQGKLADTRASRKCRFDFIVMVVKA